MSRDDQAGGRGRADTIVPGKVCAMRGMSYHAKNIIRDAIKATNRCIRRTLVGGLTTACSHETEVLINPLRKYIVPTHGGGTVALLRARDGKMVEGGYFRAGEGCFASAVNGVLSIGG